MFKIKHSYFEAHKSDEVRRDEEYSELNADTLGKLKHDVARQVEVKMENMELDSDAPYSNI
ncbi:MAG: hypothetical protein K2M13_02415 [Muribaculaceae bacterium]|nr:hypothetical protein [Muribaculaceae bacterium]